MHLEKDQVRSIFQANHDIWSYIVPSPNGRFILEIPELHDGKGPILTPNIKEFTVSFGQGGKVTIERFEVNPQKVPVDGSNVIVINGVDEFVAQGLLAKWESLKEKADYDITRETIYEFLNYARGFSYDPETQQATLIPGARTFLTDIYNTNEQTLENEFDAVTKAKGNDLTGYYVKEKIFSGIVFVEGEFSVSFVSPESGSVTQNFTKGAYILANPNGKVTAIDPTNIDDCYIWPDGRKISENPVQSIKAENFIALSNNLVFINAKDVENYVKRYGADDEKEPTQETPLADKLALTLQHSKNAQEVAITRDLAIECGLAFSNEKGGEKKLPTPGMPINISNGTEPAIEGRTIILGFGAI